MAWKTSKKRRQAQRGNPVSKAFNLVEKRASLLKITNEKLSKENKLLRDGLRGRKSMPSPLNYRVTIKNKIVKLLVDNMGLLDSKAEKMFSLLYTYISANSTGDEPVKRYLSIIYHFFKWYFWIKDQKLRVITCKLLKLHGYRYVELLLEKPENFIPSPDHLNDRLKNFKLKLDCDSRKLLESSISWKKRVLLLRNSLDRELKRSKCPHPTDGLLSLLNGKSVFINRFYIFLLNVLTLEKGSIDKSLDSVTRSGISQTDAKRFFSSYSEEFETVLSWLKGGAVVFGKSS